MGLILLLLVSTLVYLFPVPQSQAITFSFPTVPSKSTTRTTIPTRPPPSVVVKSAILYEDTLDLDVKNTGTVWTKNVTVVGICTPGFKNCFSYKAFAGHPLTANFALAPQEEYVYSSPHMCVVPVASCHHFYPVAGSSYYFEVSIGYINGASVALHLYVKAVHAFPLYSTVQGLTYQLDTSDSNGSGRLTVKIFMNSSLASANFTGATYTRAGKGEFTQQLLYGTTGCGGNWPTSCSSGKLAMVNTFSTVWTGIGTPAYPLPYLLLVRDLTVRGPPAPIYFAAWVQAAK